MRRALLAVVMVGGLASGVFAAPAVPDPDISACSEASEAIEASDARLITRIQADLVAGRYAAVVARTPEIEGLLRRHADRHRIERCGDVIRVNSGDPDDALFAQADMVGTITKSTASKITVDPRQSYLVTAYVVAAALAMDRQDQTAAIRWMAAGRVLAPVEPLFAALVPDRYPHGGALQAVGQEIFRRTEH
jgi:hypothetical protein